MFNKYKGLKIGLVIGAVAFLPQAFAADCSEAKSLFTRGMEAGKSEKWEEARNFLTKSVAECNTFNNWYLLGQTELALKHYDAAASAFEEAQKYAKGNKNNRAIAVARYAEVQSHQGLVSEPLTLLHEARKMHSNAPEWMVSLARELDLKRIDRPLTIAQVTGALNNRSIKIFALDTKPQINVNINFVTDSTEVISASKGSVDKLAEALADASFSGKKFTIIGHSDARGEDEYNYNLSEKRADVIVQALVNLKPELEGRLVTVGKGESAPLYTGNSLDDYLLNRRVEVQVD